MRLQIIKKRILYFLVFLLFLSACSKPVDRSFDSNIWKSGSKVDRASMIPDIRNRKLLLDKTEPEVFSMLGKPDYLRTDHDGYSIWSYKIAHLPKCQLLWACSMEVVFEPDTHRSNGETIINE